MLSRRAGRRGDLLLHASAECKGRAWPVAVAAAGAFLVKLWLAATTAGTNDVRFFWAYSLRLEAVGVLGLYRELEGFNHPPFMTHVLGGLRALSVATGLPFALFLRVPGILADAVSLAVLYRIVDGRGDRSARTQVILYGLAPTAILVSGVHGNTDGVMLCLVLLAVWASQQGRSPWLVGAALGMSLNIKVWPGVFAPAIAASFPTRRARFAYYLATAAVFAAGSMPYAVEEPWLILRRVFGYASFHGHWGLSRLLGLLAANGTLTVADFLYYRFGIAITFAAVLVASFRMDRIAPRPSLYTQCAVVAFTFMFLTPRFGVQYLAWLVPWLPAAGLPAGVAYLATSGAFLCGVYVFWAALSAAVPDGPVVIAEWGGMLILLELTTWVTVGGVLIVLLRGVFGARHGAQPAKGVLG